MDLNQTIAALASPPGSGARGIIRISGSTVAAVIRTCFSQTSEIEKSTPRSCRITGHWSIANCSPKVPCDLWSWPTRRSYTGQPTAELHLPGSPVLLEKILQDLYRQGVRPARPGEFTLRAFLAGKIDLIQAEAVLGVIDAHNDQELRTALDQLAGGISGQLTRMRGELLELLADLEAGLDFVEEDIEFVSRDELQSRLKVIHQDLLLLLAQADTRMTSRAVPKVVLAGLPNAGKSTLFNRLTEKSLALVSPLEGTTRDYLRAELNWDEFRLELIDTAGFHADSTDIEALAQSQRVAQMQRADLVIWCSAVDSSTDQRTQDQKALESARNLAQNLLQVWTKCDQKSPDFVREGLAISAHTGEGIELFRASLKQLLGKESTRSSVWLGMTAARCQDCLEQAIAALRRATTTHLRIDYDELLAIDLREALDQLGQIVGAVHTDDLLDRIFSKFCIGK